MGHFYTLTVTVLLLCVYRSQGNVAFVRQTVSAKAPNFDADFLTAHNNYRQKHGAPPLIYDATLNAAAQAWASNMAATDTFQHSSSKYGENLYAGWSSDQNFQVSGATPVDSWYSEIANYDFKTGKSTVAGAAVGHFTQVVWKSSQKLGVGVARSASNWIYVVANYDPPGNGPDFAANVSPAV